MTVRVCDICDIADCKAHAPRCKPKSLRDEFAMAALIGALSAPIWQYTEQNEVAKAAYKYADAMMEARKK